MRSTARRAPWGRIPCFGASREELRRRLAQQQALTRLSQLALADISARELFEAATAAVNAEVGSWTRARRDLSGHDAAFLDAVANLLASALRRQTAELESDQTHRVLEAVIEGTTDDVFVKDLEGRFVVVNESAARTLGASREELIGRRMDEVLVPQQAEMMAATDRAVLERGTVETFEEQIPVGGEARVLLTTKGPYHARDGTVLGVFGIARDITRRKAEEERLARSEETLRHAQTAARLGTWDWNLETGELRWGPILREILGVDPAGGDPTYEDMLRCIHPDDWDSLEAELRGVIASGEHYEFPCRVVRPSGETRWVVSRGTVVRNATGEATRLLGVTLDETERRAADAERAELESRLRQAEKLEALGQLAGGIAHDFNNLLVAIRGYGELALAGLAEGGDGTEADLKAILEAADRAGALTRQLLAFGRRQVLNPEVLDLNEVVGDAGVLLRRLIGENVELVTHPADEPVPVEADRGQLEQVVTNLAVNGRDAMPDGGVLTISVGTENGGPRRAVLTVSDGGSGIDEATASHIFEPFFTTKGERGTGLGLATVHGIVAQSGGEIAVESTPGRGSSFRVYLPLHADGKAPAAPAPQTAGCSGTETILLVEDDPAVRSIVGTMLAARGYEIVDAANGEEAVARFRARERPIQLVLSDLVMPGPNGRETADRIRELEPATKVLYMSGYTDDATIRGGGLGPGAGFIQKPFSGDELALRVRELLDGEPG